jgi:ribonuclease HI
VVRGAAHLDADLGAGSNGRAEWLALLHGLEVASAAGATDVILLGDSASIIDQANGVARRRHPAEEEARFTALTVGFERVRFRRIRRNQNLAGIALEQSYNRSAFA